MDNLKEVILVKNDDSQEIISAEAFGFIVNLAQSSKTAETPQEPKRGKRKSQTVNKG